MKGTESLFCGVIPDKRGDELVIKDGIKTCYPANDGEPYVLSKRDGMVYVLVENRFVKDEEYLSAEKLAKVTPTQWKQRANYFARQIQKKYRNDEMTFMECDKQIKELIERTHIQIAIYSGVLSGEAIELMTTPMLKNELVLRGLNKSGTRSELEQRLKDTIEDDDEVDSDGDGSITLEEFQNGISSALSAVTGTGPQNSGSINDSSGAVALRLQV